MSNDRKNYARFLRAHCALIANLAETIRMAQARGELQRRR